MSGQGNYCWLWQRVPPSVRACCCALASWRSHCTDCSPLSQPASINHREELVHSHSHTHTVTQSPWESCPVWGAFKRDFSVKKEKPCLLLLWVGSPQAWSSMSNGDNGEMKVDTLKSVWICVVFVLGATLLAACWLSLIWSQVHVTGYCLLYKMEESRWASKERDSPGVRLAGCLLLTPWQRLFCKNTPPHSSSSSSSSCTYYFIFIFYHIFFIFRLFLLLLLLGLFFLILLLPFSFCSPTPLYPNYCLLFPFNVLL